MVQPGAAGTLVMRESNRRNASRTCMNVLWSRGVPLPSVEAVARLISDILVGGLASAAWWSAAAERNPVCQTQGL